MDSAIVYLPIRCPHCKRISEAPYTRLEIAALLYSSEPIRLYSLCHDVSWQATEDDRKSLLALIKPSECRIPTLAIRRPVNARLALGR
jgi:hypothetical protein